MSIKLICLIIVACVLIIDAIRYRIIYFKFKKFKINGYREIAEHIDTMTRTAIPLGIDPESGDPIEEVHEKMNYMVEVLNKVSHFSIRDLNFLTRDLEFLEFHYDQTKEPLVNMEIIGPDDSYNDIGGNNGNKEERE